MKSNLHIPNAALKLSLLLAMVWTQAAVADLAPILQPADKFRVLFYGQSITKRVWADKVAESLRTKYPEIAFDFQNLAISGFVSNNLVRTAEHDIYPYYPDLMIFQVYGPWKEYEEIVRTTCERTTAAVVIQTNHVDVSYHDHSKEQLRTYDTTRQKEVAVKYGCPVADVNTKWREYLKVNNLHASDLLADQVHPNAKGDELMAAIVFEEIKDLPVFKQRIRGQEIGLDKVSRRPDESLELHFEGNRVEAVGTGLVAGAPIEMQLDGTPVASIKECWAATRPSALGKPFVVWWQPAIKQVGFAAVPVEEEWTLTCLPDSAPDGKPVRFKVAGSLTGEDGEGSSAERFVSKSGRVVIEPSDWMIASALSVKKTIPLPTNLTVKWKTYPLFAKEVPPTEAGKAFLLIQGMPNSEHTLTLRPIEGLTGFRISCPSGRVTP